MFARIHYHLVVKSLLWDFIIINITLQVTKRMK